MVVILLHFAGEFCTCPISVCTLGTVGKCICCGQSAEKTAKVHLYPALMHSFCTPLFSLISLIFKKIKENKNYKVQNFRLFREKIGGGYRTAEPSKGFLFDVLSKPPDRMCRVLFSAAA